MSFEPKSKEIAGSKFTVRPLAFGMQKKGLIRLAGIVAPALGELLASGASVLSLIGDDRLASSLGQALGTLPSKMDDATMSWFEDAFGECSSCEVGDVKAVLKLNTEAARATAFETLGLMAFFEWLAFCLEVNYGGFFGEGLARLGKKAPAESK